MKRFFRAAPVLIVAAVVAGMVVSGEAVAADKGATESPTVTRDYALNVLAAQMMSNARDACAGKLGKANDVCVEGKFDLYASRLSYVEELRPAGMGQQQFGFDLFRRMKSIHNEIGAFAP